MCVCVTVCVCVCMHVCGCVCVCVCVRTFVGNWQVCSVKTVLLLVHVSHVCFAVLPKIMCGWWSMVTRCTAASSSKKPPLAGKCTPVGEHLIRDHPWKSRNEDNGEGGGGGCSQTRLCPVLLWSFFGFFCCCRFWSVLLAAVLLLAAFACFVVVVVVVLLYAVLLWSALNPNEIGCSRSPLYYHYDWSLTKAASSRGLHEQTDKFPYAVFL